MVSTVMIKTKNVDMYMLCQKLPDGSMGTPLGVSFSGGDEDKGMVLFDDSSMAGIVRKESSPDLGPLGLYKVLLTVVGEIL